MDDRPLLDAAAYTSMDSLEEGTLASGPDDNGKSKGKAPKNVRTMGT